MSVISDFKSAPFGVFPGGQRTSTYSGTATGVLPIYTGTGLNGIPDYSYDTLCGTRFNLDDGRQVVLFRNAGTAIAGGQFVQAPAEVTAFNNLAMTVPAAYPATAGTYQILVTNGATVLNENIFAGGYAIVSAGTGIGQTLQIASHKPAATTATFVLTLADPILTTLDATSKITLVRNPYIASVESATSLTGAVIGATYFNVPASTAPTFNVTSGALETAGTPVYAFVGCSGIWGVQADATNTPAVGLPASVSTTTAGNVTVFTAAKQYVGNMAGTATSAQVAPVDLKL